MKLASLGLTSKELFFDCDGDFNHVHDVITNTFPQIVYCGGYTLILQRGNELMASDCPSSGISVKYLKDIIGRG